MKRDFQNGAIAALLIIALYVQPDPLARLATVAVGRAVILLGVMYLTFRSVPLGLLGALLALSLMESARGGGLRTLGQREGMIGDSPVLGDDKKAIFRKQHCRKGALVPPEGGEGGVDPDDVKRLYPQIKFKSPVAPCDPCDMDCKFDLLDVDETLTRGDREAAESEKGTTLAVKPALVPRLKKAGDPNKKDLPTLPKV